MLHFESLIDPACFGTVRKYLTQSGSPITDVLFIKNDEWLPRVAELLAGDQAWPAKQILLLRWMNHGQIKFGVKAAPLAEPDAPDCLIDVQAVSDNTSCRVLFLPPFYLVHLQGTWQ